MLLKMLTAGKLKPWVDDFERKIVESQERTAVGRERIAGLLEAAVAAIHSE